MERKAYAVCSSRGDFRHGQIAEVIGIVIKGSLRMPVVKVMYADGKEWFIKFNELDKWEFYSLDDLKPVTI